MCRAEQAARRSKRGSAPARGQRAAPEALGHAGEWRKLGETPRVAAGTSGPVAGSVCSTSSGGLGKSGGGGDEVSVAQGLPGSVRTPERSRARLKADKPLREVLLYSLGSVGALSPEAPSQRRLWRQFNWPTRTRMNRWHLMQGRAVWFPAPRNRRRPDCCVLYVPNRGQTSTQFEWVLLGTLTGASNSQRLRRLFEPVGSAITGSQVEAEVAEVDATSWPVSPLAGLLGMST